MREEQFYKDHALLHSYHEVQSCVHKFTVPVHDQDANLHSVTIIYLPAAYVLTLTPLIAVKGSGALVLLKSDIPTSSVCVISSCHTLICNIKPLLPRTNSGLLYLFSRVLFIDRIFVDWQSFCSYEFFHNAVSKF